MMANGLVCAAVIQMGLAAGLAALLIPTLPWALGISVLCRRQVIFHEQVVLAEAPLVNSLSFILSRPVTVS